MPPQKAKSNLFAKLGDRAKKVFEQHKNDETEYSQFGELPEGIENGTARLVEVKFDEVKPGKENAGKLYFYAAGVVVSPQEHNGVRVEGLRTSITEPLYDTPTRSRKTFDEHFAWVMNELRKLGLDTSTTNFDNIEETISLLKEAQPHFRFRTWKGQKQTTGQYANQEPRVQHSWNGVCEYSAPASDGIQVEERTAPSKNGSSLAPPPDETPAQESNGVDQYQLMELVQQADDQDAEAQNALKAMALEAGVAEADIDNAENWRAVAELINNAGTEQGAGDNEEPAPDETPEWEPAVEEMYLYKPLDPKTKKPYLDPRTKKERKPVTCEVKAVNKTAKTVDLLNMDDKKTTYKAVKWADLVTG